jgi:hypothetical protein
MSKLEKNSKEDLRKQEEVHQLERTQQETHLLADCRSQQDRFELEQKELRDRLEGDLSGLRDELNRKEGIIRDLVSLKQRTDEKNLRGPPFWVQFSLAT